jgi:hypothetical protein
VRTWTLEEATEALPRVRKLVEQIQEFRRSHKERRQATAAQARGNGQAGDDEQRPLREAMEELMAEGIVLRDPDRGLIDFPALSPTGRRYWLCWVAGEPEIGWWHWAHEGFAGRKPLSQPPT